MLRKFRILTISMILVILDQLLKNVVFPEASLSINSTLAWKLVEVDIRIILVLSGILLVGILIYFFRYSLENRFTFIIVLLIIAGGVSNLIDRAVHGGVVDLDMPGALPSTNLADVYIGCGIIVLLLKTIYENQFKSR